MAIIKMINSPRSQNIRGLHGTLSYCMRDAKTNHEGIKLITGVNCVPQFALQEFMNTKRLHNQNSGRMYYHMVQSFHPDENITPEKAHEIACKLAETIPGFEMVVATHRDAHHVHSHFVINSVSFETGKKYHSDPQSLQSLWDASDALCLQYGLSVVQKKEDKEHNMNDREYRAYERGNSWKMELEIAIDDCMTLARSKAHFLQLMEWRGYSVTWNDTRKNITYTTPQGYKCRDRKLNGRKYLKEEMQYEFELRAEICRRYAGEAKTEHRSGNSSTTNRRRHGAQLAGADLVAENSNGNRSTNIGATRSAGNRYGCASDTAEPLLCTRDPVHRPECDPARVRQADIRNGTGSGEDDYSSDAGCTEENCKYDEFDRSTLWATEREAFECNLRRAEEPAQVDAPVSAHQPAPQLDPLDLAIDTAYLIANVSEMLEEDDDDVDDYYARRKRAWDRGLIMRM